MFEPEHEFLERKLGLLFLGVVHGRVNCFDGEHVLADARQALLNGVVKGLDVVAAHVAQTVLDYLSCKSGFFVA